MHAAALYGHSRNCKLLCALDGVDENAADKKGDTSLDRAVQHSQVECVRTLLELNVDASKARVEAQTKVEIVQLLDEHRKRSVIIIFIFCLKRKIISF